MPSHLKKCFAFRATFLKDFGLVNEMLIQLWMANGFIPSGGADLEAEGHEIFHELICRSFLHDVLEVK